METQLQNSPHVRPTRRIGARCVAPAAILVIAAVLRIGGLTAESFWGDEVLTVYSSEAPTTQIIDAVRTKETAPPFYFIVINLWARCFGASDLALRLPSALMGIATVALLWRVASELFDPTVALTAAALLALAPIHIAYSQEARMYALLVLLLTLNLWTVFRVMRSGSTRWQVAYVLTAAMALLTHTFAAFTLLAVNLFWLVRFIRRGETGVTWRRWLTLNASVIVLFGPWVPATLENARMGLPWLTKSTTFLEAFVGYAGFLPMLGILGLCAGAAISEAARRRDDRILLLVLLAIVPVLGPITYGMFTTRYGIAALIAVTMLAAYGASGIGRWMCVVLVMFAALGWAMTSTLGHARYLNYTPKADVRGSMAFVRQRASDGDAVVAGSRVVGHVMQHYARGTQLRTFMGFDAMPKRAERVWVIAPSGPDLPVTGYELVSETSFDGVDVRELRRVGEPVTTRSVPSTYPRN